MTGILIRPPGSWSPPLPSPISVRRRPGGFPVPSVRPSTPDDGSSPVPWAAAAPINQVAMGSAANWDHAASATNVWNGPVFQATWRCRRHGGSSLLAA